MPEMLTSQTKQEIVKATKNFSVLDTVGALAIAILEQSLSNGKDVKIPSLDITIKGKNVETG